MAKPNYINSSLVQSQNENPNFKLSQIQNNFQHHQPHQHNNKPETAQLLNQSNRYLNGNNQTVPSEYFSQNAFTSTPKQSTISTSSYASYRQNTPPDCTTNIITPPSSTSTSLVSTSINKHKRSFNQDDNDDDNDDNEDIAQQPNSKVKCIEYNHNGGFVNSSHCNKYVTTSQNYVISPKYHSSIN